MTAASPYGVRCRRTTPPSRASSLGYLAFIGDALDAEALDHDIAYWQEEYDGRTGVCWWSRTRRARWWGRRR